MDTLNVAHALNFLQVVQDHPNPADLTGTSEACSSVWHLHTHLTGASAHPHALGHPAQHTRCVLGCLTVLRGDNDNEKSLQMILTSAIFFFKCFPSSLNPLMRKLVGTLSQLKLEHKLDTSKEAPRGHKQNDTNESPLGWTGSLAAGEEYLVVWLHAGDVH